MGARALWKAQLQLDQIQLPVKLYSAVQDRNVHFNLLHKRDHERVHERMRRASDGEPVELRDARTGYALDTGELILLEPKERAALAPPASRDIRVLHCVPRSSLPMAAFARPYWLGPDGDADELYFALAGALGDRLAICEWVMRGKHHFGALTGTDGYVMLVELHSADEWLDVSELAGGAGPQSDARELSLAQQLIEGLDAAFDHASFHDEYRERVHELIERKARGEAAPRVRERRTKPQPNSLLSALSASVRGLGRDADAAPAHTKREPARVAKAPRKAAAPRRSSGGRRSKERQHA